MTHSVLTFISPVIPAKADALRALLKQIGDNPEKNAILSFRRLEKLHFASFFVHEPTDEQQKKDYGIVLVFENNFDGELDPYLSDLYNNLGDGLHQIYQHCSDYSIMSATERDNMFSYFKAHVIWPNAYHIGNTGREARRILDERTLHDALETRADELVDSENKSSALQLFASLKDFIASNSKFSWVPGVGPRQTAKEKYLPWVNFAAQASLIVLLIILLLPISVILAVVLLGKESTDSEKAGGADNDNIRNLVESEDHTISVQNHMASITVVKPGWLRRLTLWLVLRTINLLARAAATHGELSGIPSIHFAHWSMIDGGRRLLFVSNFDGSWENYLDDFIDKAHYGLTAVWSNTVNFPRTHFLVLGGATDGPRFKAIARDSQTVTNAWYSAYLDLTVQNIDNSSSIREDIFTPLDPTGQEAWLQRL